MNPWLIGLTVDFVCSLLLGILFWLLLRKKLGDEEAGGIGGLVSVAVFFVGIGLLISFGDTGGLF